MAGPRTAFGPDWLRGSLAEFAFARRFWVSLSGGADSSALLLALARAELPESQSVSALHVHHGLHPEADDWCKRCEALCETLGVPLHTERIRVGDRPHRGVEAEARALRYAAAERLIGRGDVLLTAHHAGDQAETVLMHLMRGSGLRGLSGIPRRRRLGPGWVFRPLLDVEPGCLRDYLLEHGVPWVEDGSNRDESLDRNFVRRRVLPLLGERWPDAPRQIALSAQWCREASDFVDASADALLRRCQWAANVLDLRELERVSADQAGGWGLLVRRWLERAGAPPLPRARLAELRRQLDPPTRRSAPAACWSGWRFGCHRGRLWLHRGDHLRASPKRTWDGTVELDLGGVQGRFEPLPAAGGTPWRFQLRPLESGDRIACLEGGRHKLVKRVLQEAGVPPWLRACVPVLLEGDEPVAVGPWALSVGLRRRLAEAGGALRWHPGDPGLARLAGAPQPERG